MDAEQGFDFLTFAADMQARGVAFVLIGRQAVRLYGAPVETSDFDVWVDAARRVEVLELLDDAGFELSDDPDGRKPIVFAIADLDKLDLLFMRGISNKEAERIEFSEVLARSRVVTDPATGVTFRIPDLDDLIALKKCRLPHARDEEDLRYLLVRRDLERKGGPGR